MISVRKDQVGRSVSRRRRARPRADVLRAFANRTLGGNIVLYTSGEDGAGFQFAISNDQNWIIIQDDANQPQTSCFYDQGNDVFMRFNNTVPAP